MFKKKSYNLTQNKRIMNENRTSWGEGEGEVGIGIMENEKVFFLDKFKYKLQLKSNLNTYVCIVFFLLSK